MSNKKLALHFGAGNIGRGFICPELKKSNYDVVFVDVNEDLINEINLNKEYKITSLDINSESSEVISDVSGINLNDKESINSYLLKADLVSTSVGPQHVQSVFNLINSINISKQVFFIAFENQYRSSTQAKADKTKINKNIICIDAVVDKIVPPQNNKSLDVVVEKYGSVVLDDLEYKPLDESNIVTYRDYEVEFLKKLWLINGLHLKLAYFGISKELEFIHEIFENNVYNTFATEALDSLTTAFIINSKYEYDLTNFKKSILDRFSKPELNDEMTRVARNPINKFSVNERFQYPLKVLIENNENISSFSTILDILFNNDFPKIEGFGIFKKSILNNGRESFYKDYWEVDNYFENYVKLLGD